MNVSFIVPLYNNLPLTQGMVASLQATLPPGLAHEILLIDDGSTDGTRAWLAGLAGGAASSAAAPFRVLLNDRNLGFAATNNRAAAEARGEHLVLLNNDLIFPAGWFEPLLQAHHALGRRAGVVGNLQFNARTGALDHAGIRCNEKGKPEHDRQRPTLAERLLRPVRRVPAVTAACLILDADLWRQLGGFDEGYVNGGEDVDLCFRARAAGRINAVALRSAVRHYVSAAPGRKLRDEANSHRLAARWHEAFIACAAREWCRQYVRAIQREPRNFAPGAAARIWLHAIGLTRRPPRQAVDSLRRALDLEFARWKELGVNA